MKPSAVYIAHARAMLHLDGCVVCDAPAERRTTFVTCDCCGGEGFIEYGNPNAPYAARTVPCEECGETGTREVELHDIDEEDL